MQRQTTIAKTKDIVRNWYLVDATNVQIGRLASEVATILLGKNKVIYTPNVDCGDYVIVINAKKVFFTGNKIENKKYYNVSGYAGGLRIRSVSDMINKYPVEMVERAVYGMLPKGKLGRKIRKKLFVYSDNNYNKNSNKIINYKLKYINNVSQKENKAN